MESRKKHLWWKQPRNQQIISLSSVHAPSDISYFEAGTEVLLLLFYPDRAFTTEFKLMAKTVTVLVKNNFEIW